MSPEDDNEDIREPGSGVEERRQLPRSLGTDVEVVTQDVEGPVDLIVGGPGGNVGGDGDRAGRGPDYRCASHQLLRLAPHPALVYCSIPKQR